MLIKQIFKLTDKNVKVEADTRSYKYVNPQKHVPMINFLKQSCKNF